MSMDFLKINIRQPIEPELTFPRVPIAFAVAAMGALQRPPQAGAELILECRAMHILRSSTHVVENGFFWREAAGQSPVCLVCNAAESCR